jgi:hypothetical protein
LRRLKKSTPTIAGRGFLLNNLGGRIYAGTSSIFTLRPNARTALPSVCSVTEELDSSSNGSTSARHFRLGERIFFQQAADLQAHRLFQRARFDFAKDPPFIENTPQVAASMIFLAHMFCKIGMYHIWNACQ